MKKQVILKKKELAFAVGMALFAGAMSGCSSSDDGVAGNNTINTNGGNGGAGATAYGGVGGYVDLYLEGGLGGINVSRSGKASTSFTSQKNKIKPFYGVNPLAVTSDTTIPVATFYISVSDGGGTVATENYVGTDGVMRTAAGATAVYATDPMVTDGTLYRWSGNTSELYTAVGDDTTADLAAAGTPYMAEWDQSIYTADADDTVADIRVTGLSVAKGATLTFENNYFGGDGAELTLGNDVVNHGTITTADSVAVATRRGYLSLNTSSFINDGTIDTSGSGTVIDAGRISIWADYSAINAGVITAAGADNAAGPGGDGGALLFRSDYYTENTGDLTLSGGDGSTGNNGGDSGYVAFMWTGYGATSNSGNITATGGNGDIGGDGGEVQIENEYAGGVLNSGDINTSAGAGSAGNGGSAGNINFYGYGGLMATSGMITAMGGDASVDNNAGSGGHFYLYNSTGYASWDNGTTPQGDIEISGDIDTRGGNSSGTGSGGDGGYVYAENDNSGGGNEDTAEGQGIYFKGYSTIDTSGGSAQFAGTGGDIDMYANYGWDSSIYTYGVVGPVNNAADLIASAGAYTGTADTLGHTSRGGDIALETSYYYGDLNPKTMVTNSGDITSNGADGLNNASNSNLRAGGIWAWGFNGVNNSGTITLNGGNDSAADGGTDGRGGNSGYVELYAELGPVVNSGSITANGGDGEYRAGYGSDWTAFYGPEVRNSGKITGAGGDFDVTLGNTSSGNAGYGGWVWMMGDQGPKSVSNSGAISLTPGASYAEWAAVDTLNRRQNGYYIVIGAHCEGDC